MRQEHIYSRYDSFKLPFAEAAIVNLTKNYIMDQYMLSRTSWHIYPFFHDHKERVYLSKIKSMSETPNSVFLFDIVDELAITGDTKETQVDIRENTKFSICHAYVKFFYLWSFCSIPSHLKLTLSFLRNVQNERDITSEGGSAKVFIVALDN